MSEADPVFAAMEAFRAERDELRAQLERALAQRAQFRSGLSYVLQDLHPAYGSTAGPYGGIGGQMVTAWCHVNDPFTDEHQDRLHELRTLLQEGA